MEEEHDVIKELVEKIVIIIVGSVIAAYGFVCCSCCDDLICGYL